MTNRIQAQLTVNTTGFQKNLNDAQRSANEFAQKTQRSFAGINRAFAAFAGVAAGAAAAGALEQIARAALNAAGSIADASKAAGIGAAALQEYRAAAKLAGVEQETLDAALNVFSRSLGDARRGNNALAATFAKVGVAASDTAENALEKTFRALGGIADESVRASVANDLFGRSGVRLAALVADGAGAFEASRKQARDLGLVLSDELVRASDAAGDRLEILDSQMRTRLQQTVLENVDGFIALREVMNEVSRFAAELGARVGGAAVNLQNFFDVVRNGSLPDDATLSRLTTERETLQRQIKEAAEGAQRGRDVAGIAPQFSGLVADFAESRQRRAGELSQQLRKVERAIVEARAAQKALSGLQDRSASGPAAGGGFTAALANVRNPFAGLDGPTLKTDAIARNLEKAQERIAQIAEQTQTPLDALRSQLAELESLRPFAENADQVTALDRAAAGLRQQMAGLNQATQAWGLSIEDTTRQLSDAFADAIVRGENLLGTLKRLAQQIATRALSNFLFNSLGGALGIPLGGARADGGPVQAGRAFLVGERGPEIFTPSVSGTVIPNGANLAGGVNINQTLRFDVGLESVSERIATMTPTIAATVVDAVQRAQARPRFA